MKNLVFNSLFVKLGTMAASLAFLVTAFNVNATCISFIHQPELPEGAKDLRRF